MHWFHIIYVEHIKPPWCHFYINHPRECAFMVFEQHKNNKMDSEKMQLGNSAELHKLVSAFIWFELGLPAWHFWPGTLT